jgi:hypothetical protein
VGALLEALGIRRSTWPNGRKTAYVRIHFVSEDGMLEAEVGVDDSGSDRAVLEEARFRFMNLFEAAAFELEITPLTIQ